MRRIVFFMLVIFLSGEMLAQVVIAPGTDIVADAQIAFDFEGAGNISMNPSSATNIFDFQNAALTFLGVINPNLTISGTTPLTVGSLSMNSAGLTLNQGSVEVTKDLMLQSGLLNVSSNSKLVYSGSSNLSGSLVSYINGKLFIKGSGQRTFPIGNTLGYLPVTLEDIKPADANTEIGFEAIVGNPNIASSLLTPDIKDVFTTNYWMMTNGNSGSFSGSVIQLSLNSAGSFFNDGDPIVLEVDTDGKLNNLSGIPANPDVTSALESTAKGQKYALGKSENVTVNIHRVITPNADGQNDYLYIDGIDFYAVNNVKLVDRWGVVHFEKVNFKNYSNLNQPDFDFSKLSNGNYICVVELGTGPKIKPKMISVVK